MGDFLTAYLERRKALPPGAKPVATADNVIRSHKDIVKHRPRKGIVQEYFRQKVVMLNADKENV